MKILLIAATEFEVESFKKVQYQYPTVAILIAGVGMTATAYRLGKYLAQNSVDLLLNVGIAGCFDYTIPLGSVFQVEQDCFYELGAEDAEDFIPIDALGFGKSMYAATVIENLQDSLTNIKKAKAITVNRVHGHTLHIEKLKKEQPQLLLESMEGAAVFLVAEEENIPAIQLRAISNYVERRNRYTWNIPLALENLHKTLINTLDQLL